MFDEILAFFATPVWAQSDYGLGVTAKTAELTQFGSSLPTLLGSVIGAALSLVGVLFFALMLYGGITWMLAHGNAEQEKKALSTITAAIIGILIVLGSYALTSFVFSSMKGAGGGDKPPASPPASQPKAPPTPPSKITCDCDWKPLEDVFEEEKSWLPVQVKNVEGGACPQNDTIWTNGNEGEGKLSNCKKVE